LEEQSNTVSSSDVLPQPRSFATFITQLEDGRLHHDLSTDLQDLAEFLIRHAHTYGGKAKGKMQLSIELSTEEGEPFIIRSEMKVSKPKMSRPRSVMYADSANNLVPHNPRQLDMFGVRDVTRGMQPTKQL
jgi:hypothetical protein